MSRKKEKNSKHTLDLTVLFRSALLQAILLSICLCVFFCGCGRRTDDQEMQQASETMDGDKTVEAGQTDTGKGKESSYVLDKDNPASGSSAAANSGINNGKEVGSNTAEKVGKESIKDIYQVGDTLQDGSLKITYMASGEYAEESEYKQPQAGYKYIFLQYGFQNTDPKNECPISLFAFNCFADGYAAQAYYGEGKELPVSLAAGRSAIGNIYFCVPEDAKEIEVEYQPDNIESKKIRFIYEGEKNAEITFGTDTKRTEGAFHVGDTAASDQQRILYLSCEKDDSDNENVHPAQGCTYYTLTFEFENLTEEERQISVHDFSCYADDISCDRTLFRDDYLSENISGGRKAKGTVTFEVPDGAQIVEAEYDPGRSSDAHVVFTVR